MQAARHGSRLATSLVRQAGADAAAMAQLRQPAEVAQRRLATTGKHGEGGGGGVRCCMSGFSGSGMQHISSTTASAHCDDGDPYASTPVSAGTSRGEAGDKNFWEAPTEPQRWTANQVGATNISTAVLRRFLMRRSSVDYRQNCCPLLAYGTPGCYQ